MSAWRQFVIGAALALVASSWLSSGTALAGGGGENMLLVVNPNDPASLQIANAYAALRDIPANNILFLAPPSDYHNDGQPISQAEVMSSYLTPINNAISARGLTGQINSIGTIGQALSYNVDASSTGLPATTANSLDYALSLLTPLTNGSGLTLQGALSKYNTNSGFLGATSGLYRNPSNIPINGSADASVQHSASYSVTYYSTSDSSSAFNIATQYYLAGTIGYTGTNGNTAAQVISSLQAAVAADGSRPSGVVYFENSGDSLRSGPRIPEWSATERQLSARGIPWVQEDNTTPTNRSAVLGAVCGASTLALPNGSTYVGGSWADNLTSYGCYFPDTSQTKATAFITAGASGTTGAVIEPYNITQRFTNSSIYTFVADGATLGEAFAKSVATPDIQMPLGDMLAQPFADVPKVAITSSPGNYGTARGTISVGGSAALSYSSTIATAISNLELLVDGMVSSSGTGGSGTFSLSTSGLSDGVHEVRVVAINNAKVASEGYQAEPIVVNNHGRAINYNGGNTTLTSSTATFNLAATVGDGTISRVELTCLGRVVAQASGSPGSLGVSTSALAPGDNNLVPVAVFSDGSQVAGGAFVVHVESGTVNAWSTSSSGGLWSNLANWSGGVLPQNGDGVARFTSPSGAGTVTLDVSPNLQELDFNTAGGNYTLAASTGQTLTLSSSNGPMSQSLINVSSGNHTISSPVVLSALGNLVNVTNPADSLTISGRISGVGALTETGSGTFILTGSNTYSGTTTIDGGTLQVGAGGAGGSLGSGAVVDNSVVVFNRADTYTLNSPISGTGSVVQSGPGTLVLGASVNSYGGSTLISGGTLKTAAAGAIPATSPVVIGSGAVLDLGGQAQTVAGITLTDGAVQNSGAPTTLTLSGIGTGITYAGGGGGSSISGGTLNLASTATPVSAAHYFSVARGQGSVELNVQANLADGAVNSQSLVKTGSGILQLSGTNSYTGGTQLVGGTLLLGSSTALPPASDVIVSAGTLNLGGYANSTGTVMLQSGLIAGAGSLSAAAFNLQSGTASASLTGSGTLNKSTSGVVVLSGSNNYTGGTIVSNGTLKILHSWSLPDGGSLTVGNPALFQDPVVPSLVLSGTLAAANSDTITYAPSTSDLAASDVALADPASTVLPAVSSAANSEIVSQPSLSAVPEPGALLLLLAAGSCALLYRVAARPRPRR